MARVTIETRAAAAAKKLARDMGWSRTDALGRLYFFWHDSQELEQTHCTLEDVVLWMDVEPDDETKIIPAMIKAKYLSVCGDGPLLICGNEKHIENLKQRRESSRENGKLGGRPKVAPFDAPKNNLDQTQPVNLDEPSRETQPNPAENLQFSAVQYSAVQYSALEEGEEKAPAQASDLIGLWQKECDALPKVLDTQLSPARADAVSKAIQRKPDLPYWQAVIARIHTSDYLTGRNGKRNPAGFDFMVEKHTEILEGKYDNPPAKAEDKPAALPLCTKCTSGLIRATNRSSGASEHCACTCALGRKKTSYTRFDENRFERIVA